MALFACGDAKTLSLSFSDSVSAAPGFIVSVRSDDGSNFTQNQAIGENPSTGQLLYYYGAETKNLKNCAVATSLVELNSAYHVGTPALSDCTNYVTALNADGLFPPASAADLVAGPNLDLVSPGYTYALFFYNPTNSTSSLGINVAAGQAITTNNRCVKIWAARVQDKKLIQSGQLESTVSIDLSSLTCFGF
jgi:hypothetical protein